eukprot:2187261-Alexandrium_andersonii.AAC.1
MVRRRARAADRAPFKPDACERARVRAFLPVRVRARRLRREAIGARRRQEGSGASQQNSCARASMRDRTRPDRGRTALEP